MKRLLASVVLSVFLLSGCVTQVPVVDGIPEDVVTWAQSNVWKLDVDGGKAGSAWWLDKNYAITACHVVSGVGKNSVITLRDNLTQYEETFTVVTCSADFDTAILLRRTFNTEFEPLPTIINDTDPRIGATLYAAGYPAKFSLLFHKGWWNGPDLSDYARNDGVTSMTTGLDTGPGDSGSPVLEYKNGHVQVAAMRLSIRAERHGHARTGQTGIHYVHYLVGTISGPIIITEIENYGESLNAQTP